MSTGPPRRYASRKPTKRKAFNVNLIRCPELGCGRLFKNRSGLTQHRHAIHGFSIFPDEPTSEPADSESNMATDSGPGSSDSEHEDPEDRMPSPGVYQPENPLPAAQPEAGPESDGDEIYRDYHLQLDGM